jgi:hypothetical protein
VIVGSPPRYRLLDTTRACALERLDESGERERLLRSHAEYYRHLFERAEVEWETRPTVEWLHDYGWSLDHCRPGRCWCTVPSSAGNDPNPVSISSNGVWYETGLADHVIEHLDGEGTSDLSPQHGRVALLRVMTRSFRPSCSSDSNSSSQPQSLKSVPPEWEGDEGQYCPDPHHQRDQRRIQAVLDRNDGSADLRCHSRFEERDLRDWSA